MVAVVEEKSPNYYEVLGVAFWADAEEIARAYRQRALLHHPDRGGEPARMVALNQAYEVLGDPFQREVYDEFLGVPRQPPGTPPRSPAQAPLDGREGVETSEERLAAGAGKPAERPSALITLGRWVLAAFDLAAVAILRIFSSDALPWLICYGAVLLAVAALVQHLSGLLRLP